MAYPSSGTPRTPPAPASEIDQRILAVLKLNDGRIEGAMPLARIRKLMVHPPHTHYTQNQVRRVVRQLEERGLVIRDLQDRFGKPVAKGTMSNEPGRGLLRGVYMVDTDYRVEQWAIDELKDQITKRLMGKAKSAQAKRAGTQGKSQEKNNASNASNEATEVPALPPAVTEPGEYDTPADEIARSLLARVIHVIAHPPEAALDATLKGQNIALSGEVQNLREEIDLLKKANKRLQENCDTLKTRVEDLDAELAGKNRRIAELEGRKRREGERLTMQVKDLTPPEVWERLQRQPRKGAL